MATDEEVLEAISGVRVEMADLRKNEQWRQQMAEEQHATTKSVRAALVVVGATFLAFAIVVVFYIAPILHIVESVVNPDGERYKKGQAKSAQIVKSLLDNGTTQGRLQAERLCQVAAAAKLLPITDPVTKMDLCPGGHAPAAPSTPAP